MADDFDVLELAPDEMLERIYDKVLRPNFSPDELEPLEDLRGYLDDPSPEAFGLYAVDSGGDPIGRCIYYPYSDSGSGSSSGSDVEPPWSVLLLGYIAVVKEGRSRGVGTRLFRDSQKAWFGSGQYDLAVAELDDPRVYPTVNGIDPERRITFYSRLGVRLVRAPYFAPCVRPGGERVYDMLLSVLDGVRPGSALFPRHHFRRLRWDIPP